MSGECFAYVRVSTVKQGEGVSLEAQREAINAFAERNNLSITKWFEEKETAAKSGRPVFSLVKELYAGKAAGLIIHKIDRSARNIADWAKIGELSDSGINIHFATESLDFKSCGGRLTADIQAVIAADYIRNLREETKKGLYGRLKQGIYPFKAPIGYLDTGAGNPKKIDPEKGHKVKEMFEAYARGEESMRSLVTKSTSLGLTSSTGNPLCKSSIETILSNPFYMGVIKIKRNGSVFSGIHEPLISAKLFNQVQRQRNSRTVRKNTKRFFTYRAVFKCAICKNGMIAERQKGHSYYRCHTQSCPSNTVREDALEDMLIEIFARAQIDERLIGKFEKSLEKRLNSSQPSFVKVNISKVEAALDRLTNALADGILSSETYTKKKEELELQKKELQEKQRDEANKSKQKVFVREFLELAKSLSQTYQNANPQEKACLVRNAFSNLFVKDKTLYFTRRDWMVFDGKDGGVLECAGERTRTSMGCPASS